MSKTRERPIILHPHEVRAALDGRLTQVRRPVKFNQKPWLQAFPIVEYARDGMPIWWLSPPSDRIRQSDYYDHGYPCPFGSPGDRLWCKEMWGYYGGNEYLYQRDPGCVGYKVNADRYDFIPGGKWRPSTQMPRWASRLTLEITSVRVERAGEISEEDAQACGVEPGCLTCGENCLYGGGCGCCRPAYRDSFVYHWKSTYGSLDDWAWVVGVRRGE